MMKLARAVRTHSPPIRDLTLAMLLILLLFTAPAAAQQQQQPSAADFYTDETDSGFFEFEEGGSLELEPEHFGDAFIIDPIRPTPQPGYSYQTDETWFEDWYEDR